MPFGLKNAGATYQRLVTKMFRPLLGSTMKVYIDDMLVKSKQCPYHVTHLQQAFDFLREYGMKLNPLKCAFKVSAGKFLGFMVTQRGIDANPLQLKAILQSTAPSSKKEIQQLIGRLAALGHFISRFTDQLKPFFTTLREARWAEWDEECDRALVAVAPPTRHPKWMSSGGVTLRDWDPLTFSFSSFRADTCIHMHKFCNNKNSFYIYIIHTTIVAFIYYIPIY